MDGHGHDYNNDENHDDDDNNDGDMKTRKSRSRYGAAICLASRKPMESFESFNSEAYQHPLSHRRQLIPKPAPSCRGFAAAASVRLALEGGQPAI